MFLVVIVKYSNSCVKTLSHHSEEFTMLNKTTHKSSLITLLII